MKPSIFKHITCRNNKYPQTEICRFPVPDDQVPWSAAFPDYSPPLYTAPHVNGQVWADPEIGEANFSPKWNSLDGKVHRDSYIGQYDIKDGVPLNPFGRTGLKGRGLLGRWGPNFAADPIVTRWKRDLNGEVVISDISSKKVLQMVAIQRHDNKMWAIPGGMVDGGEKVSATLKREFMEEALDNCGTAEMIDEIFSSGTMIYEGYVDDFRNTDNAWIETSACSFHDENGDQVGRPQLQAGDDAASVRWMDLNSAIKLHANHVSIVKEVVQQLNAHW